MNILTRLQCNPSECKEAVRCSFEGEITLFCERLNRNLAPGGLQVKSIDEVVIACGGLRYPIVRHMDAADQTVLEVCSASVVSATIEVTKLD